MTGSAPKAARCHVCSRAPSSAAVDTAIKDGHRALLPPLAPGPRRLGRPPRRRAPRPPLLADAAQPDGPLRRRRPHGQNAARHHHARVQVQERRRRRGRQPRLGRRVHRLADRQEGHRDQPVPRRHDGRRRGRLLLLGAVPRHALPFIRARPQGEDLGRRRVEAPLQHHLLVQGVRPVDGERRHARYTHARDTPLFILLASFYSRPSSHAPLPSSTLPSSRAR